MWNELVCAVAWNVERLAMWSEVECVLWDGMWNVRCAMWSRVCAVGWRMWNVVRCGAVCAVGWNVERCAMWNEVECGLECGKLCDVE